LKLIHSFIQKLLKRVNTTLNYKTKKKVSCYPKKIIIINKTFLNYRSNKGIHLLIIISGQGEKLEIKLGLQGEMEK